MSYIITHKEVITRKEQKCFGCARKFPRNTKMVRETVKDDVLEALCYGRGIKLWEEN